MIALLVTTNLIYPAKLRNNMERCEIMGPAIILRVVAHQGRAAMRRAGRTGITISAKPPPSRLL